ncbi:FAD-dependent oxidoreductase [Paracoccus tegillarcae]|uniref:D-amino-acid oxidase n=1 Tax=Paracoccus tegillarcae TaxID=1529068 RepID=A0A2K9EYK7_9RHOB|nr:FAD-dependent oxidoreductase [Paracoccus tegillarcae]AUH33192.1 FAD-dependent oxidoreductase [Paracoccus tegillarcae]
MISVLGAGVAGLCAATSLARAGLPVEVILPTDAPPAVSALAGGMLAPFCEGEDAPDLVVTRGAAALDWWSRYTPVTRRGTLVLAPPRDSAELDRFARATTAHRWVEPAHLEPDLAGRFVRGLFFAREGHLDPGAALAALRQGLLSRGVHFRDRPSAGRGDKIVDCRGTAAADLLPDLRSIRGEMLMIHAPDVTLTRPIRLIHPRFPCYVVPRGEGRYMIGATMVETAQAGPITARAVMELLAAAYAIHPAFAEARLIETGVGLRPSFPDNIPALRRVDGRVHMNGMHRHGFLMAPVLADELAQMLTKETADAD